MGKSTKKPVNSLKKAAVGIVVRSGLRAGAYFVSGPDGSVIRQDHR